MKFNAKNIAIGGLIAALYVVLCFISSVFGLASGIIQIRLSEVLCILPVFTPAAVPGLFVGCLLSNLIFGGGIWDIIFGSLATLIGAFGTYFLRKHRFLSVIPPILSNMIIVPLVMVFTIAAEESFWILMLMIGASEFICAGVLGELLYIPLNKNRSLFQ